MSDVQLLDYPPQLEAGYELLDGVPTVRAMGAYSQEVAGLLLTLLNSYIRPLQLGRAYPSDVGYQCFPGRPKHLRKPDVSFVQLSRVPNGHSPDGHYTIAPDLAVEVVSPHDSYESLETKVAEYRSAGVRLIWIISPMAKTVLIRRLDGSASEVNETGHLSGEDVVPGFSCAVAGLFL